MTGGKASPVEGIDVHPSHLTNVVDVLETDLAELREAAQAFAKRWGPHSGACCTMVDGKVAVTRESCRCEPVSRRLRDALGDWASPCARAAEVEADQELVSRMVRENMPKATTKTKLERRSSEAPPSLELVELRTAARALVVMMRSAGHNEPDDHGAEDLLPVKPFVRCFACASHQPEAACSHWVGIGWSCTDRKACRTRRATPDDPPTPRQALDGLFNGAAPGGIGGVHAAKLFNIVRADLDAKYSRDELVAALEALEASAMSCAAHLIARWLRRYADEHSGSHQANAGYIACNAAATELETGRATWRADV